MRCFYSPYFELDLPEGHVFTPEKYRISQEMLLSDGVLRPEEIVEVDMADYFTIKSVHDQQYIEKISQCDLERNEQHLLGLPPAPQLYARCATEVEATRLTCHAALEEGLAVCLGGGMHHAYQGHGETFCVFNDIAIAIRDIQMEAPDLRVMVADTDALQGVGLNSLLLSAPNVYLYSLHTGYGFGGAPQDVTVDENSSLHIALPKSVEGDLYLRTLFSSLADALEKFRPHLVIWVSGCDQLDNDQLGKMRLSPRDLIHRDEVILGALVRNRIPCAVLYGGGYNKDRELTARMHSSTVKTAKQMGSTYLNL